MILDMQDSVQDSGMITFPDFAFAYLPRRQPIRETVVVVGSTAGATVYVTGVMDEVENE